MKNNRKIKRKGPPAWMNEARAEASAPTNLAPLTVMIADIDAITNAEDAADYTPPASMHLFTGRDLGWDRFCAQVGESRSNAELCAAVDEVTRVLMYNIL